MAENNLNDCVRFDELPSTFTRGIIEDIVDDAIKSIPDFCDAFCWEQNQIFQGNKNENIDTTPKSMVEDNIENITDFTIKYYEDPKKSLIFSTVTYEKKKKKKADHPLSMSCSSRNQMMSLERNSDQSLRTSIPYFSPREYRKFVGEEDTVEENNNNRGNNKTKLGMFSKTYGNFFNGDHKPEKQNWLKEIGENTELKEDRVQKEVALLENDKDIQDCVSDNVHEDEQGFTPPRSVEKHRHSPLEEEENEEGADYVQKDEIIYYSDQEEDKHELNLEDKHEVNLEDKQTNDSSNRNEETNTHQKDAQKNSYSEADKHNEVNSEFKGTTTSRYEKESTAYEKESGFDNAVFLEEDRRFGEIANFDYLAEKDTFVDEEMQKKFTLPNAEEFHKLSETKSYDEEGVEASEKSSKGNFWKFEENYYKNYAANMYDMKQMAGSQSASGIEEKSLDYLIKRKLLNAELPVDDMSVIVEKNIKEEEFDIPDDCETLKKPNERVPKTKEQLESDHKIFRDQEFDTTKVNYNEYDEDQESKDQMRDEFVIIPDKNTKNCSYNHQFFNREVDLSNLKVYEDSMSVDYYEFKKNSDKKHYMQPEKLSESILENMVLKENLKQYPIVKEGWLKKRANNFLKTYQKKYFILEQEKLIYFTDEKKTKMRGCINFKLAKCAIKDTKGCVFSIEIEGYKRKITLKAFIIDQAVEWIKKIFEVISGQDLKPKISISDKNALAYWKNDIMSEEELKQDSETGDILLFQTDNLGAKLQRSLTGSKYDHVAMIVRYQAETYVFDSQANSGVALSEWDHYIDYNNLFKKVVYRKLLFEDKNTLENNLIDFVNETIGMDYHLSATKLLRKNSIDPKLDKRKKKYQVKGYFCSELIAAAFKRCNLLDPVVSSAQYWPGTFSTEKKIKLLKNASLSPERSIVLERHLKT